MHDVNALLKPPHVKSVTVVLVLRSSLVLSFLCEYVMGIRHLLWLRASAYGFIRTNEERSTSVCR